MQIVECPKCRQKMVKIYTKGNVSVSLVLQEATETAKCRNCGQIIAYSVLKNGGNNGGNREN